MWAGYALALRLTSRLATPLLPTNAFAGSLLAGAAEQCRYSGECESVACSRGSGRCHLAWGPMEQRELILEAAHAALDQSAHLKAEEVQFLGLLVDLAEAARQSRQ
jgi:hypothetical protein